MGKIIANENQLQLFNELVLDGYDFFTGVPDSCLKNFIQYVDSSCFQHVGATWEAEAIGLAAGAYLAGRKPCVYMQNAGLSFAINPLTSLCIPYGIEIFLVIGHRHTLPQHRIMGEVDKDILELIGWSNYVLVDKAKG